MPSWNHVPVIVVMIFGCTFLHGLQDYASWLCVVGAYLKINLMMWTDSFVCLKGTFSSKEVEHDLCVCVLKRQATDSVSDLYCPWMTIGCYDEWCMEAMPSSDHGWWLWQWVIIAHSFQGFMLLALHVWCGHLLAKWDFTVEIPFSCFLDLLGSGTLHVYHTCADMMI